MKQEILALYRSKQEAIKSQAELTLKLFFNHPAGIGDHSTKDLYSNITDAMDAWLDAESKLKDVNLLKTIVQSKQEELHEKLIREKREKDFQQKKLEDIARQAVLTHTINNDIN